MKIYTQTFDLAQPMSKMISVAQNSDFGIGIKIVKNGVAVEDEFTVAVDGETLTPEADKISGFTIYILNSGDADKTYTVTCKGQSFKLTQNTTESSVFDLKPAPSEPAEKYGASIDNFLGDVDANGVLQAPSAQFDFVSEDITRFSDNNALLVLNGNKSLKSISLPNLTTIDDYGTTFKACTNLLSVNYPSLTSIGQYGMSTAFQGCTKLTSVHLDSLSSVTSQQAMANAFNGCSALTNISIDSLQTVNASNAMYRIFYNCTNLEYVSLSNLTSIAGGQAMDSAFRGCSKLKYVNLKKLSSLGAGSYGTMFMGCTSLQYVDFSEATAIPKYAGGNAMYEMFQNTNNTFKIIVPDALYDSWIADDFWANLSAQIVKASEYP